MAVRDDTQEETRAFLQRRVAGFGLLVAALFGVFLAWRLVYLVIGDDSPTQRFMLWQAVSVAAFGSVWLLCRGRPRSVRFVQVTEATGMAIGCAGAMAMAGEISYVARPDFILLLSMAFTLLTRSIMIPSTRRLTLLMGTVMGLSVMASVYFMHHRHHDPAIYTALADPRLRIDAATTAAQWTLIIGLWWVVTVVVATATSSVIYGLREQVRDARRLGQYTLIEKLGQGGMGEVYRARHAMLRRPTAVKLLPPDKLGADSVARFEREVQQTARLTHPNTIRIFDYGRTPDGIFYYAMEHLEGASLADAVAATGPMPAGRVIHLLDQVAGALAEAHGIGLIHRDIKPANIFVTEQGGVPDVVKVLDFGLVKEIGPPDATDATLPAVSRADSLTGTPQYMAPEAITTPDRVDPRIDLYAIGCVGYWLLTGRDVFTGRTVLEVCSHHLHTPPIAPSQFTASPVSADLEELILRCLDKDPAKRPADARQLQAALRACRDARSWSEDDARAWFSANAEVLRARRPQGEIAGAATIAIDLDRRGPAATERQRRAG